MQYQLVINI